MISGLNTSIDARPRFVNKCSPPCNSQHARVLYAASALRRQINCRAPCLPSCPAQSAASAGATAVQTALVLRAPGRRASRTGAALRRLRQRQRIERPAELSLSIVCGLATGLLAPPSLAAFSAALLVSGEGVGSDACDACSAQSGAALVVVCRRCVSHSLFAGQ